MSYSFLSSMQVALPLLLLAAALPGASRWRRAEFINAAVAVTMILHLIAVPLLSFFDTPFPFANNLPTLPGQLIAALVGFLGAVIVRYSATFLLGEAGREQFLTHLQMTLAGVVCVVLTDHLLLLLVGWVVISLSLHRLLLFYPDRPRAVLAAHKKFLLARSAELLLLIAIVLLYTEYQTLQISVLRELALASLPGPAASTAAVLIACVALIKCAQLPMHGWLVQVVEAPTPVSALLHAGVINLGGFLLISFAPLINQVPSAQCLVLLVAGLTMVVAALIMSLQPSVKVRLAWSTSAQMGLMLVQCALGLYALAMLHLVAHACYKAYSFLSAGSAVERHQSRRLAGSTSQLAKPPLLSIVVAAAAVIGVAWFSNAGQAISQWLLLLSLIVMALSVMAVREGAFSQRGGVTLASVLLLAYVGQKVGAGSIMPDLNALTSVAADLWVSFLIMVMAVVFWLTRDRSSTPLGRWLSGRLAAGLYLDEWFTRVTLRVWPAKLPKRAHSKHHAVSTQEAI